jgi:hypothetical protein
MPIASPFLQAENWKYQPELFEKFQAGVLGLLESEKWAEWLQYQRRFHRYSPGNVMLIMNQNPEATQVASLQTWNRQGRSITSGSHGMKIWTPVPAKKTVELDDEGEEREVKGRTYFRLGTVFDVSQTQSKTGQEPPEVVRLIDEKPRPEVMIALTDIIHDRGLQLQVAPRELLGGANGVYRPAEKMIVLAAGLSDGQTTKTMAHELAHSILHGEGYDYRANRPDAELEAESVAYLVCGSQGLDSKDYSFGYVAGWASEMGEKPKIEVAERLLKATKAIKGASETIVGELEAKLAPEAAKNVAQKPLGREVSQTVALEPVKIAPGRAKSRQHSTNPPGIPAGAIDITSPAFLAHR